MKPCVTNSVPDVTPMLREAIAEHAATLAQESAKTRQRPLAGSLAAEVLPLADSCRSCRG